MAGLNGPDRKEFCQLKLPADCAPGKAGDVKDATGGSNDFPGVSADGRPNCWSKGLCSSEKCVPPLWRAEK